jgi:hypothetical protein
LYLLKWVNLRAPNEPSQPVTGIPGNEITKDVLKGVAHIPEPIQVAPKKTFTTRFGEQ